MQELVIRVCGYLPFAVNDSPQDVRMVRAALLYADRVELVSPASWLRGALTGESPGVSVAERALLYLSAETEHRWLKDPSMSTFVGRVILRWLEYVQGGGNPVLDEAFRPYADDVGHASLIALLYEDSCRFRGTEPDVSEDAVHSFVGRIHELADRWDSSRFREALLQVIDVSEVTTAAAAGAPISVDEFDPLGTLPILDEMHIRGSSEHLLSLHRPDQWPMFDAPGLRLIRKYEESGLVPTSAGGSSARAAAVADHIMTDVPAVDQLSIEQILEIRDRVEDDLAAFRAELLNIAGEVAGAFWTPEFTRSVRELVIQKVVPRLEALRRSLAAASWPKVLADELRKAETYALPIAGIALNARALIPLQGVLVAERARAARAERLAEQEGHPFMLLHRIGFG